MMWKMAFRNLFRNRRRTLATGVAVVAGFVGLTLLGGFIYRIEKSLMANSVYLQHRGHVTIYKTDSLLRYSTRPNYYQIKKDELDQLQAQLAKHANEIEWVGYTLTGSGLISNGVKSVPFLASGVDLKTLENSFTHPLVLKWCRDFLTPDSAQLVDAIKRQPRAISITSRLGDLINRKAPYAVLPEEQRSVQLAGMNLFGDLNAVDAELAVTHTTGSELLEDAGLIAPIELLQELYSTEGVHYTMLYLKDSGKMKGVVAELNSEFKQNNLPFEAYPFNNPLISPNYVGSMGFLYAMAGFFVFLICGAVALSIINSLTMGILERTREIGTFRAIGFQPQQISWMMTQEAIWLGALSGVIGTGLVGVIALIVNNMNFRFSPPGFANSVQFILSPSVFLILTIFVLFLILVGTTSYAVTHFKLKQKVVDLLSDSGA